MAKKASFGDLTVVCDESVPEGAVVMMPSGLWKAICIAAMLEDEGVLRKLVEENKGKIGMGCYPVGAT